ncbi:hypothetical protein [Streptomyces sp. UNOC14_S4]|uniref:hypothetical protein n=1 Tax=Streptomyces sp. UNOC14_S4 TaxID=2872340 RepID=UPI001E331FC5|nr:hypothetical protein [Streptomyces sp. UNOC14_S4]MCC3770186.1 hypothetical protein [Streptomyces sp. UNOC14_S4]
MAVVLITGADSGPIVHVGSVTSEIISPFQGPYVAAEAAEDRPAEITFYENSAFGIDAAVVRPGAYTSGTDHFAGARHPDDTASRLRARRG